MLDINLIRTKPDLIRKNLEKRRDPEKTAMFENLIELDKKWRQLTFDLQKLKKERNDINRQIANLKKQNKDFSRELKKLKDLPRKIEALQAQVDETRLKIDDFLLRLPNLMHDSVPYGRDETENVQVRAWGTPITFDFELKSHGELAEQLGVADFTRSRKIAGAGFYFLKNELALLNQAIIRFAIDFMIKKGFVYVEPPLMMRRQPYEGVTDLADFELMMYKIENEDLYMIATSEHPLVSQFMNETIAEEELPIKMTAYSMCFRKEAGTHNVDEKGLFRSHQFNKVEQVILCKPEDSWKLHEELLKNSEELFEALELPYRITNICTGDLGTVAAKKYDLEAWFSRQKKYREVCSCSNCTDYQARRLNIKCGKEGGKKRVLHTLNNTAIATSRVLVAILENNQNKDGSITIPKVLIPYMNGIKTIKPKPKKKKIEKKKQGKKQQRKKKEVKKKPLKKK